MSDEQEVAEATPEEIREAKSMGWSEKEHWRGNPDQWLDARAFLEKGRELMPVLRANNQELLRRNEALAAQLRETQEAVKAANAAIEALEEAREADVRAGVEAARADLKTQLAEASERGDHQQVAELTDKMTQLNTAQSEAKERDAGQRRRASDKETTPQASPYKAEIDQWMREHPNYASDARRIALANVEAARIRQEKGLLGRALLEAVYDEVEAILDRDRPAANRVGSSAGESRSSTRGTGRSYSDLPADAKAICDKQASRFVGANRAYKTNAEWQKAYAEKYFAQG